MLYIFMVPVMTFLPVKYCNLLEGAIGEKEPLIGVAVTGKAEGFKDMVGDMVGLKVVGKFVEGSEVGTFVVGLKEGKTVDVVGS